MSLIDTFATQVTRAIGREVRVFRSTSSFYIGKFPKKLKTKTTYTIVVEGVYPAFYGLTINEAKGRLAMLLDMLQCGVIKGVEVNDQRTTETCEDRTPLVGLQTGVRDPSPRTLRDDEY